MKHILTITILLIATLTSCAQQTKEKEKGQWLKEGETVSDTPDRKTVKGFGANLIVVTNPEEWIREWLKPEKPNFNTVEKVKAGEEIGVFVLFAGCKQNSDGICNTEVDYTVFNPKMKIIANKKASELWKEKAPPESNTHFGKAHLRFELRKSDLIGKYKIKAKVYDNNADVSFELETEFTLESK